MGCHCHRHDGTAAERRDAHAPAPRCAADHRAASPVAERRKPKPQRWSKILLRRPISVVVSRSHGAAPLRMLLCALQRLRETPVPARRRRPGAGPDNAIYRPVFKIAAKKIPAPTRKKAQTPIAGRYRSFPTAPACQVLGRGHPEARTEPAAWRPKIQIKITER